MKGCIFDIKRFTLHDGPGIRTTVFLKGCPLYCIWCHNPEGLGFLPVQCIEKRYLDGRCFSEHETIGYDIQAEELLHIIKRDSNFYRESGGGVTFSGGEPLSQTPFLLDLLKQCQAAGIHTCVDTSGYASKDDFIQIAEHCDMLLIDLKHADDAKHIEFTGVSNQQIIKNIKNIKHLSIPVWLRLPMIPNCNMDDQSWNLMLNLLDEIKSDQIRQINLLPFHQIADHKYIKCELKNRMKEVKGIQKADLLPYLNQLSNKGWKQIFIGG